MVILPALQHLAGWKNNNSSLFHKHRRIFDSNHKRSNSCINAIVSRRSFDIVLSYYAEDIDFVARYIRHLKELSSLQKLHPRIIVYNKNARINTDTLKDLLQADIVQLLPNVGREGATYLHHIIENYDLLGNHTLFSQAGVEGITGTGLADWYADRLDKQFNASVGFMPLVSNSMITAYDCGSHRWGHFPRMIQIWSMLEQSLCPPGGQAVSRGSMADWESRIFV